MEAELARQDYTMMLFNVPRRRRLIPSNYRILSQRIIKRANVPVMLVRNVSKNFERMLVCTGGLEISEPVVHLSTKLAGSTGLLATLLTVSVAVPSMYTGMEELDESLEKLLGTDTPVAQHLRHSAEELTTHGIPAEIKIRHGDVVEAILEETKEGHYDLVVLGETEGSTLRGLLLGNVTQQIVNRAPCAVLISKSEAEPAFEGSA
jgi:nucleotide-binding universal stress UspA family protein